MQGGTIPRWDPVKLDERRIAQADTIIPGAGNPQAWDRYAYALNNPVKYVDPTGHYVACGEYGEGCGKGGSPIEPPGTGSGGNGEEGKGGTLTPTNTPTPTSCPLAFIACLPTATSTPTPTVTPTGTPPTPETILKAGPTPYPTITPFAQEAADFLVDHCFGSPSLSGATGCGEIVDMAAQGAPLIGIPVPNYQYGKIFDEIVGGSYALEDLGENIETYVENNVEPLSPQARRNAIIYKIAFWLIVIPGFIPP